MSTSDILLTPRIVTAFNVRICKLNFSFLSSLTLSSSIFSTLVLALWKATSGVRKCLRKELAVALLQL